MLSKTLELSQELTNDLKFYQKLSDLALKNSETLSKASQALSADFVSQSLDLLQFNLICMIPLIYFGSSVYWEFELFQEFSIKLLLNRSPGPDQTCRDPLPKIALNFKLKLL